MHGQQTRKDGGFTLVEILVVISIISILLVISYAGLNIVQTRSRDTKRQSDINVVASALQRFYSDNANYPLSSSGQIAFNTTNCTNTGTTSSAWGSGRIICNGKSYLKQLPTDPKLVAEYCYSSSSPYQTYALYAKLEKAPSSTTYTCNGISTYNYRVTPGS